MIEDGCSCANRRPYHSNPVTKVEKLFLKSNKCNKHVRKGKIIMLKTVQDKVKNNS